MAKAVVPSLPRCPICRKPSTERFAPFCSARCTDVDLSRWLTGSYAIPGEPADPGPDSKPEPER